MSKGNGEAFLPFGLTKMETLREMTEKIKFVFKCVVILFRLSLRCGKFHMLSTYKRILNTKNLQSLPKNKRLLHKTLFVIDQNRNGNIRNCLSHLFASGVVAAD